LNKFQKLRTIDTIPTKRGKLKQTQKPIFWIIALISIFQLGGCQHTSKEDIQHDQLLAKAQNGDLRAQRELGESYKKKWEYVENTKSYASSKENSEQDILTNYQEAVRWYTIAAEQGDTKAQYALAMLYDPSYVGSTIPHSLKEPDHVLYNKALTWYLKASAKGDQRASAAAGNIYEKGKYRATHSRSEEEEAADNQKAAEFYLKAEKNNPAYFLHLARQYLNGAKGYNKDINKAIKYLKIAAAQKTDRWDAHTSIIAGNTLGKMYSKGIGVKKDYREAFYWYANSCELLASKLEMGIDRYSPSSAQLITDGAIAEFNLAWLYEHGFGTPKDYSQALKYYSQAAQKGLLEAKQNYSVLSKKVGSFKPA